MKVGFACGVFDIFHAGHALMLKDCRAHCDFLIVAVNEANNFSETINPGKRKPVYTLEERKLILESSKYVDRVVTYSSEEELLEIMKQEHIDVRFLGDDYVGKAITGAELGYEIVYINRDHGYSTTSVLKRIRESLG